MIIRNQCSDVSRQRSNLPRQWSNLPRDILSQVANRLGLIDLVKFRLVCKDFLSASSTATAKIEYLPWFLLYGQGSRCCLLSYGENCTKRSTLNIPQLRGATCLASSQGWLLMFRKYSVSLLLLSLLQRQDWSSKFPQHKTHRQVHGCFFIPSLV